MTEGNFKKKLKDDIRKLFPDCIITQLDPTYIQGIPDLLILFKNKWAALECKKSPNASKRPNQEYWINTMNNMSYASFISPESKDRILNELEHTFKD